MRGGRLNFHMGWSFHVRIPYAAMRLSTLSGTESCSRFHGAVRVSVCVCAKRALIEILHEIFREKDVERPIDRDADFLLDPRQFTPINAAPEKPGEKS